MTQGVINQPVYEYFTVINSGGTLIPGIDATTFTTYIYNPSDVEVSASVGAIITELSNGNYKLTFTPDVEGNWYVMIIHPTYFPWGKTGLVQIYKSDTSQIYDDIAKILGLSHHNIYIDNPSYDDHGNMVAARLRIYSNKTSVGTNSDVIETYLITSNGTACGQFSFWSQTQV